MSKAGLKPAPRAGAGEGGSRRRGARRGRRAMALGMAQAAAGGGSRGGFPFVGRAHAPMHPPAINKNRVLGGAIW
jgi:hypothetical protein